MILAKAEDRQSSLVAVALLLLAAITFSPWTPRLGLLHDDWSLVNDMAQGRVPLSSPDGLRPLLGLPWRLCGLLFGKALVGFYGVLFALQWIAAVLLYRLARLYGSVTTAGALAALAMVYPGDASHLWLATLTQGTALVLALAAILVAEIGRRRESSIALALLLGFASLGLYELQLPLLAFWPGIARVLGSRWPRRSLILWSLLPGVYVAWRFAARPALGLATVATADFSWQPATLAERMLLRVPYNLFLDGWLIAMAEAASAAWPVVGLFALGVTVPSLLLARRVDVPARPRLRGFALALVVIALGVAPVVPTTYWLGRAAGTFGGRILAAAIPGAALLLLLAVARLTPKPRARALAFSILLTFGFAFHWNVARVAAENWSIQKSLSAALSRLGATWPPGTFFVVLDLPANRLSFDVPMGVGRMIQETLGDSTLSGIGVGGEHAPGDVLSIQGGRLLVHGGAYGVAPLERVVVLRWRQGLLEPVPRDLLLVRMGGRSKAQAPESRASVAG